MQRLPALSIAIFGACIFAVTATAQGASYLCQGTDPDWTIELGPDSAQFTYGRSFRFSIPQRNSAQNRDWPRAMTLLEDQQRYTAIVVMDQKACTTDLGDYAYSAYVLTQRASAPIMLAGCCDLVAKDAE
ncbi:hypothetical protein [Algirhabdus cladophorae]|uniref:hypothetical protein n=1 Tax=Algirhabdus cladophorae TaxID=3377108 RepID=UPI003B8469F0